MWPLIRMGRGHDLGLRKRAREITDKPAWVKGMGVCYDAHYPGIGIWPIIWPGKGGGPGLPHGRLKKPRRDIDVVELGDEFSYQSSFGWKDWVYATAERPGK